MTIPFPPDDNGKSDSDDAYEVELRRMLTGPSRIDDRRLQRIRNGVLKHCGTETVPDFLHWLRWRLAAPIALALLVLGVLGGWQAGRSGALPALGAGPDAVANLGGL